MRRENVGMDVLVFLLLFVLPATSQTQPPDLIDSDQSPSTAMENVGSSLF